MELIVIDESKVKVMLSATDMQHFELDVSDMDYENRHTRSALKAILEAVRIKSGLDVTGEKMLVQVYPSKGGGCEMFISRLSPPSASGALPRTLTLLSAKNTVFRFRVFEHLLAVCRALDTSGYSLESAAYRGSDGMWYLQLQENRQSSEKSASGALSFVQEYAEHVGGGVALAYVKEHCKCVIEKEAVKILASLCSI
ncbi:MAG: adaptor protein MecA [Clostridia bacterium]|nr:adaptor protein MecA [Clostridia bacterium]